MTAYQTQFQTFLHWKFDQLKHSLSCITGTDNMQRAPSTSHTGSKCCLVNDEEQFLLSSASVMRESNLQARGHVQCFYEHERRQHQRAGKNTQTLTHRRHLVCYWNDFEDSEESFSQYEYCRNTFCCRRHDRADTLKHLLVKLIGMQQKKVFLNSKRA